MTEAKGDEPTLVVAPNLIAFQLRRNGIYSAGLGGFQAEVPRQFKALDALPLPKAGAKSNNGFLSKDGGDPRSLVKGAWRTASAVFKRSGVPGAHPHRFRHTLSFELLGQGGRVEEIAGILGDSAATIPRYYAKWTLEFQTLQDEFSSGTAQKESRIC